MVWVKRILTAALFFCLCNAPLLAFNGFAVAAIAIYFAVYQVLPVWGKQGNSKLPARLNVMLGGYELFATSALLAAAELAFIIVSLVRPDYLGEKQALTIAANVLVTLLVLFITLANGFFRILFTSKRLRLVPRLLLIFLWWFPVVNIALIWHACRLVKKEYRFETAKTELENLRKENEICKTKYPILLVHGIFFRDWQLMNYWGRIPKALVRNGAELYYGSQQSAASIESSAGEIRDKIRSIVEETGCEKVNIIAHSKGGLDSRYAISRLGMDEFVASLTTVNTPHKGCAFVQHLLDTLPEPIIQWTARKYQSIFTKLGDREPDFLAGVKDLRADACAKFNEETPDKEGVLYQSTTSVMRGAFSAPFPLCISYGLVKRYDGGKNDGLVNTATAQWGEFLGVQEASGKRGISHGDMIDLMREDIPGFDVPEFYVDLVHKLKDRGL